MPCSLSAPRPQPLCLAGVCALLLALSGATANAERPGAGVGERAEGAVGEGIALCMLPHHRHAPRVAARGGLVIGEAETNNTFNTAQALPLGTEVGESPSVTLLGDLSSGTDDDFFSIDLEFGDVVGVAIVSDLMNNPDTEVEVLLPGGVTLLQNDLATGGRGNLYPPDSPLPRPLWDLDSFCSFVAPEGGTYRIRIGSFADSSSGQYTLDLTRNLTPLEQADPPERQIIFLDFDGASINAEALFGAGNNPAVLSPLSVFLPSVGLSAADESAVIDAVVAVVQARFDALESVRPNVDFEIRNSRDHADTFGQPNVSRVIIGGTSTQLGFSTIGIAEFIDPGNFSADDTAVVVLDAVLAPAGAGGSAASFPRAPGFSVIDVAGRGIGNIAAHEAGHYLGNWHTQPDNGVRNIMDSGSPDSLLRSIYGLGTDGVFGTADDDLTEFLDDVYDPGEILFFGTERIRLRTATALLTLFNPPAADLSDDGFVGPPDLSILLAAWGTSGSPADLDDNGVVGPPDLSILLASWSN